MTCPRSQSQSITKLGLTSAFSVPLGMFMTAQLSISDSPFSFSLMQTAPNRTICCAFTVSQPLCNLLLHGMSRKLLDCPVASTTQGKNPGLTEVKLLTHDHRLTGRFQVQAFLQKNLKHQMRGWTRPSLRPCQSCDFTGNLCSLGVGRSDHH